MRRSRYVLVAVFDQGASSLTNMLALVLAAQRVPITEFSYFATCYVIYTLFLSANQAYLGQPLVLEGDPDRRRTMAAAAVRMAALLGAAVALVGASLLLLRLHGLWPSVGVLMMSMPVLLLQDVLRFVASAARRPTIAAVSDTLWLMWIFASVPIAHWLALPATASVQVIVWAAGALLGIAPAVLLSRHIRLLAGTSVHRVTARGYLGYRFVVEFAATRGASQGSNLVLGAFSSAATIGALRGATTLFGPLNVLFNALEAFGPPLFEQAEKKTYRRRLQGLCLVAVSVAASWGLALNVVPDSWGTKLMGQSWTLVAPVLLATAVQYVFMAVSTTGYFGLRITDPRSTLALRVYLSVVQVAASFIGFLLAGVVGIAWGLAAATAVQGLLAWAVLMRKLASKTAMSGEPRPVQALISPRRSG